MFSDRNIPAGYLGTGRGVGLSRGLAFGAGVRSCFRTGGGTLGFVLGKSSAWTGSARRTSGSDILGFGIGEAGTTVGWAIGAAGAGLVASSTKEAWGAMIFSDMAVAAGEGPAIGCGLGLRR